MRLAIESAVRESARTFAVVIAGMLALGVGIGGSLGIAGVFATHDDPGEHHACVHRVSGTMRYVTDPAECTRYERAVSWNEQGVPGISGYEIVKSEPNELDAGMTGSVVASCPEGKSVLGGGGISTFGFFASDTTQPELLWSFPDEKGNSWEIAAANDTESTTELTAFAICATVGP